MRVISLVPSLTETLIECGVDVVGRTRFCIHPADKVANIPTVGGTKGVDWQKCQALTPDLVVFDREENVRQMAADCPFAWTATHIESIEDCVPEFHRLSKLLGCAKLADHSRDWQMVADKPPLTAIDWSQVPGTLRRLVERIDTIDRLEYMIWKDPWMAVGENTFIHSVLFKLGFGEYLPVHGKKYPQIADANMTSASTFYFFSSEPYRFARYEEQLNELGVQGAIVDGEVYSWFGIRSLKALQRYLNI